MSVQPNPYPADLFLAEMKDREAVPVCIGPRYMLMVTLSDDERKRLVSLAERGLVAALQPPTGETP